MKKHITKLLILLLVFSCNSFALQMQFTKIVDTNTAIPNGTGNFTRIEAPYVFQNYYVFRGYGNKQAGIYSNLTGKLTNIANNNTPIPNGQGNFVSFGEPSTPPKHAKRLFARQPYLNFNSPAIDNSQIAFVATGKNKQMGEYLYSRGQLKMLADKNTTIPNTDIKFNMFASPYLSAGNVVFYGKSKNNHTGIYAKEGDILNILYNNNTSIPAGKGMFTDYWNIAAEGGDVAFLGYGKKKQLGIYSNSNHILKKIADNNTPIPDTNYNFTSLGGPSLQNGYVAFRGTYKNKIIGIYADINNTLVNIVDNNTPIPNGRGNFTNVTNPTIDHGRVLFTGAGKNNQQGIYLYLKGRIYKIIDNHEQLDNKKIKALSMGAVALSGNNLAFLAKFTDNTSAIYTAKIVFPNGIKHRGV